MVAYITTGVRATLGSFPVISLFVSDETFGRGLGSTATRCHCTALFGAAVAEANTASCASACFSSVEA